MPPAYSKPVLKEEMVITLELLAQYLKAANLLTAIPAWPYDGSHYSMHPPPALHPAENRLCGVPGLAACLQDWAIPMRGRTLHMLEHAWAARRAAAQHGARLLRLPNRDLRPAVLVRACCVSARRYLDVGPSPTHPLSSACRVVGGGEALASGCWGAKVGDFAIVRWVPHATVDSESRSLSPVSTFGWCAYDISCNVAARGNTRELIMVSPVICYP